MLSTAGNLVFTNLNNRLLAFKADTGDLVLDLATGLGNPGPPMTFMLDGRQYIAIAGSIGGGGGGGGAGGGRGGAAGAPPAAGAAPQGGPQPSTARLLVLVLEGKAVTTSTPQP
jgi:hypothetical protein